MKERKKTDKKIFYIAGLFVFLMFSFALSLSFGSVTVSLKEVIGAFISPAASPV